MTSRPATIETKRLLLISLLPEELEALIASDVERASKLAGVWVSPGWPADREAREGLAWHFRHLVADPAHIPWRVRVVVERSSGSVVGAINLKGPPDSNGDAEIGWGIVESCRRQGYAVEATAAVMAWALSISATVPSDNIASQRIARRLGMTCTASSRRNLPLWQCQRPNPVSGASR